MNEKTSTNGAKYPKFSELSRRLYTFGNIEPWRGSPTRRLTEHSMEWVNLWFLTSASFRNWLGTKTGAGICPVLCAVYKSRVNLTEATVGINVATDEDGHGWMIRNITDSVRQLSPFVHFEEQREVYIYNSRKETSLSNPLVQLHLLNALKVTERRMFGARRQSLLEADKLLAENPDWQNMVNGVFLPRLRGQIWAGYTKQAEAVASML